MHAFFHQAAFLQSATNAKTLPAATVPEVAFAGRSNCGKSSTINRLCGQKSLARTSKTPGRTQLLNFFTLGQTANIVDLPGYGYAKVPHATRLSWQAFIESYLLKRTTLKGVVVIMDIRHPMTDYDQQLLHWLTRNNLPSYVLLNKADKLKRGPAKNTFFAVQKAISDEGIDADIQLFSAQTGEGLAELQQQLLIWLSDI